jgi:hypothetical protein
MAKSSREHLLENYRFACEALLDRFRAVYFKGVDTDIDWIGFDFQVVMVNDYFFSISMIYEALLINASKKDLFDYYDLMTEPTDKPVGISFINYCKYPEERSKLTK